MKKRKIKTMEELSATIGVSRPTLSRYFQDPDSVRGSTSAKIREALEQLDYVPNFFATRMNRKTTGLIGVIIPLLTDLFFASLLEAIERAAMSKDFTVITQSSHGDPEIEARAVEKLISMSADGVIVAPLGANSRVDALERLSRNLPIVLVDSRLPDALPGVDFIGTNNKQSIELITDYLCRTGEPPVFLGMPRLNSNAAEREEAYVALMDSRGYEPRVIRGRSVGASWRFEAYAHEVMTGHFSHGRYLTCTLLCANDRLAIGALRAATQFGLFSGREAVATLRIAGHDDQPLSRFTTPSLTTVAQDIEGIAREAMRVLGERIAGTRNASQPAEVHMFEATLKLRESA